jgi:murein DD-endopeptidase MepM/ murein hydrolase activator NlpD
MEMRQPASELEMADENFHQEKPLMGQAGELSVGTGSRALASLSVRIDRAIKETGLREQSILSLWATLSERQSLMSATPSIKPAKGWFTSRFGYRISPFTNRPVMHNGIDIAAAPGSPVYAPADGVISYSGYDAGYGKLISIDHGYGVVTRYGHNSKLFVSIGQKVKRWDVIGAVGSTGRSTGPHLHYEVRVNGVPVDPINYVLEY